METGRELERTNGSAIVMRTLRESNIFRTVGQRAACAYTVACAFMLLGACGQREDTLSVLPSAGGAGAGSPATPAVTAPAQSSAATPAQPATQTKATPTTATSAGSTQAASAPATSAPATSAPAAGAPAATGTTTAGTTAPVTPAQTQSNSGPDAEKTTMPASDTGAMIRGPEPTEETGTKAGPYKVGKIDMGFRRGQDFSAATIYYPEDAQPPFAMIVFCPGWLGTQASDQPWSPFMASHGIVFMNIDTNTIGDSVVQRQAAELDALQSLLAENERADSPLKGKLALDHYSFMGWSMGGGGAWLNAQKDTKVKAIVTLAGHDATAGGAEVARGITVPTLMLAGTADTAVLGLGMSQPVYDIIPETTPKLLYEVEGASHFDFNDPAYLGGVPARYALSWMKVYLEGDMRWHKFLLEKGPQASDFRTTVK